MSRSNRSRKRTIRITAASVSGLLILGATVGVGGYVQLDQRRSADDAAAQFASDAQAKIDDTCSRIAVENQANCAREAHASARQGQTQAYDLYAQQTMALWTTIMSIAAVVGVMLSMLGVYLIFVTFQQTRRGALWAGVGSRHSRKALTHMRTVSDSEFRPYLFVEQIELLKQGDGHYRVGAWLKNFGKTPARKIRTSISAYPTHQLGTLGPLRLEDPVDTGIAAPGHHRRAYTGMFLPRDEEGKFYFPGYIVFRLRYTYESDQGQEFSERGDWYTEGEEDFESGNFYLLTDWSRKIRADLQGELFRPDGWEPRRRRRRRKKQRSLGE